MDEFFRILIGLLAGICFMLSMVVFAFGFAAISPFIIVGILYDYIINYLNKKKSP